MKAYIRLHHIILEALGLLGVLISFIFIVVKAATIEGTVATHYGFDGQPDGFGSPMSFISLPITMLILLIVLILINHLVDPKYWNMPVRPKAGRELIIYSDMILMTALMCLESGIYTVAMTFTAFIETAPRMIFTTAFVISLAVDVIVSIGLSIKHNK